MGFNFHRLGLVICVFLATVAVVTEVCSGVREFSPEKLSCCKPPKHIRCCCCLPSHANYTSAAVDPATVQGNSTTAGWLHSAAYALGSARTTVEPERATVPKVGV
ncbi:unnamed protein product [Linum trigynum]|uniref:Secreted protein n=1 Tax=Linum trigynum TaxID=586398 RepID=A0AAV2G9J3_9ROSI